MTDLESTTEVGGRKAQNSEARTTRKTNEQRDSIPVFKESARLVSKEPLLSYPPELCIYQGSLTPFQNAAV